MEFITIGRHVYVNSMTPDEWQVILTLLDKNPMHVAPELRKAAAIDQCWLPRTIGQRGFDAVNRYWTRHDVKLRLSSDPPNAPWANPDKKLRFQTIDDYIKSLSLIHI